jgi:hypothetical protein
MRALWMVLAMLATNMSSCSGPDSQYHTMVTDSIPVHNMAAELEFLYSAVSSFAVTDRACLIADQQGILLIDDLESHHQRWIATHQYAPQLIAYGQNVMVTGRWSHQIQWWNSFGEMAKHWDLKPGLMLQVGAFGKEAMMAYSETNPNPPANGKDAVSLLPSRLLQIDSTGNLDSTAFSNLGGIVSHLAFNAEWIGFTLCEFPRQLRLIDRKSGKQTGFTAQADIVALTNAGSDFLFATESEIVRVAPADAAARRKATISLGEEDALATLQLLHGGEGRLYRSTSEGVMLLGKTFGVNLTTSQAVEIKLHGADLLALENRLGLRQIGNTEEWVVKFP